MKTLVAMCGVLAGCAAAPVVKAVDVAVPFQELAVVTQGFKDVRLRLVMRATAPEDAVVTGVDYELVVDEKVVKKGHADLNVALKAGSESADFAIEETAVYVATPEELKALEARTGSVLMALRGTLHVKASASQVTAAFARSREVRLPKLPKVKLTEVEGARYSDKEASTTFHVGIFNPNAFVITTRGATYTIDIAGKRVAEATLGAGEKIGAGTTGVFDVQVMVGEGTHGKDVGRLIKGLVLPWKVSGTLKAELVEEPFEFNGSLKLNASK